jgi:hypothetical protein
MQQINFDGNTWSKNENKTTKDTNYHVKGGKQ